MILAHFSIFQCLPYSLTNKLPSHFFLTHHHLPQSSFFYPPTYLILIICSLGIPSMKMGGSFWCDTTAGLKRGPWTPEEDRKLLAYVQEHGHGSWSSLPQKAGHILLFNSLCFAFEYKSLLKKIYMLFFLTSGVGGCNLQQIFKGVGRAAD